MNPEELKEQVKQAIEGDSDPVAEPEIVSSPEVKVEVEPVVVEPEVKPEVVDNKDKEIASNLTIALKEEREARKAAEKKFEETQLAAQEALEFKRKMEGAFAPKVEEPEVQEAPKYLTQEDLDRLWDEKEQKRIADQETAKKVDVLNQEVKKLETTWDGKDGKPKYDDQEVLKWQSDNQKLYLSPEEAFFQMKRNDIIDFEAKQRLNGVKVTPDATQPSSNDLHIPTELTPKTPQELRNAVMEAMDYTGAE